MKSSLKFIFRHLWKGRLYTFIKVAGLTLGMTCMLLAVLFVQDEYSFDRFHAKGPQLYRITTTNTKNGNNAVTGTTGQVQGPAFKMHIPEVLEYVRLWPDLVTNIISDQKALGVNIAYADTGFFKIFSFPLVQGSASNALAERNSIVLTEETALRFFGKTNVIGQTLKIEEGHGIETFLITGIAKNVPAHSSIQFEAVLPFSYLQSMFDDKDWLNSYVNTFVLLHPHASLKKVQQEFSRVFQQEARDQLKASGNTVSVQYGLQPITNMHLNVFENAATVKEQGGSLAGESQSVYSYLLMGIAFFILVMACVNFLNLSIAGFWERSKEIGVRKITGGTRGQIIQQFLYEATVICGISYLLSVILVVFGLPVFNELATRNIHLSFGENISFFIYGLLLMVVCVLLVGLYPAIKLSLFDAVKALTNKQKWSGKNYFGKSLIVVQFSLAMGLLFASIIYYKQMSFISNKALGYNPSDIIQIQLPPQRADRQTTALFKKELAATASIKQIGGGWLSHVDSKTLNINGNSFKVREYAVDEQLLPTLEMSIKEGRNFSSLLKTDSQSVIVNETFVKEAGWKYPLHQKIAFASEPPLTVVGVVKDFHTGSLKEKIEPQMLELKPHQTVTVRAQKNRMPATLAAIEKTFRNIFPNHYYQVTFLEDEIGRQYTNEHRWKLIISYSTVLAVLICCIGLFGLAHFATIKRTKEIGIRKVLGASTFNLLRLISDDFLKLVLVAALIISPVVWYVMNSWLQDFAYRIHISFTDLLITIIIALLVALFTVGSQVIRAALQNPVKSLRTE